MEWLLQYIFCVTRGKRQGSVLSPYLFKMFINQPLPDLNNCDADVGIGDTLFNAMAYADEITLRFVSSFVSSFIYLFSDVLLSIAVGI